MNQQEFEEKYKSEIPMYESWGQFVLAEIIKKYPPNFCNQAIKIAPCCRTKTIESILAKAFVRKKRTYDQITDKVGMRFVVLLENQIKILSEIIEKNPNWSFSKDKCLDEWKKNLTPSIFEYKSVHYIVRLKEEMTIDNVTISQNTPCEIQIRTLLQHAYAEMSHDNIYKANTSPPLEVERIMAKSMALMETTDDLLCKAHNEIKKFVSDLITEWQEATITEANNLTNGNYNQKDKNNNVYILNELTPLLKGKSISSYKSFMREKKFIFDRISFRENFYIEFKQELTPLIYYLAYTETNCLPKYDVFANESLQLIYSDLGIKYPE